MVGQIKAHRNYLPAGCHDKMCWLRFLPRGKRDENKLGRYSDKYPVSFLSFLRSKYLVVALRHVPCGGFGSPLHGQKVPVGEILQVRSAKLNAEYIIYMHMYAVRSEQTNVRWNRCAMHTIVCAVSCGGGIFF